MELVRTFLELILMRALYTIKIAYIITYLQLYIYFDISNN